MKSARQHTALAKIDRNRQIFDYSFFCRFLLIPFYSVYQSGVFLLTWTPIDFVTLVESDFISSCTESLAEISIEWSLWMGCSSPAVVFALRWLQLGWWYLFDTTSVSGLKCKVVVKYSHYVFACQFIHSPYCNDLGSVNGVNKSDITDDWFLKFLVTTSFCLKASSANWGYWLRFSDIQSFESSSLPPGFSVVSGRSLCRVRRLDDAAIVGLWPKDGTYCSTDDWDSFLVCAEPVERQLYPNG